MALTPGADNVNEDGIHAIDVEFADVLGSLTLATDGSHRRVSGNPTAATINFALPALVADIVNVAYLIRRSITDSNDVNLVPNGSDEINGSNDTIHLPKIGDWIEVVAVSIDSVLQWVIISELRTISAVKEVFEKNDFPAPVAGVITLDSSLIYHIDQFIILGTDRIELNGASIQGISASKSALIYSGTGALLSSTNVSVGVNNVVLQAPNGSIWNCIDDGTHAFIITTAVSTSFDSVGLISNFKYFSAVRTQFENGTTNGFVFTGSFDLLAFRHSILINNAGVAIDLSGITAVNVVNFNFLDMTVPGGASAVKNVAGSTNVTEIFRMQNCDFRGAGTYVDTFTRCDAPVVFNHNFGNGGTEDSTAKGISYIAAGAEASTPIADLTSEVLIAGTYSLGGNECKFDASSGMLTYLGDDTITFNIGYKMNLTPASGNNREYWTYVRLNGSTLNVPSRDSCTCSASDPSKALGIAEVRMVQGDYIELIVIAQSHIVNVTASALTIMISA